MGTARSAFWFGLVACVALAACSSDKGSSGSSNLTGSGNTSGGCAEQGSSCAKNGDCCGNAQGTAVCLDIGGGQSACAATCKVNGDCKGNCCSQLQSGGLACSPSDWCSGCVLAGKTCAKTGDCCGSGAGLTVCVSDDTACHDTCTANAQCKSGCCASLKSGGKVCAAASYCAAGPAPAPDGGTGSSSGGSAFERAEVSPELAFHPEDVAVACTAGPSETVETLSR